MSRYYAWVRTEENALIVKSFANWNNRFRDHNKHVGFFDLAKTAGKLDSETFLKLLIAEIGSPKDFDELVILPLYREPGDFARLASELTILRYDLAQHTSGEAIHNIFVFPIIKIREKIIDADRWPIFPGPVSSTKAKKTDFKLIPSIFLFQGTRLTLDDYSDLDWLNDIENFIYLTLEIERQGLPLFSYFPAVTETEIATFATQTIHTQKYLEIKNYVLQALNGWIETQLVEQKNCRSWLRAIEPELEKINRIESDVSEDDLKREATSLDHADFKYFTSINFNLIKNHLLEFEIINLIEKLQVTAAGRTSFLNEIVLWEFENKVSKLKILEDSDKVDYLNKGKECLIRADTSINCLLKEIEDNLRTEVGGLNTVNRVFERWVADKVNEAGVEPILRGIAERMKQYLMGIPLKVLALCYMIGFTALFYLLAKISNGLPFHFSIKWRLIACLFLSLCFPWLYHRYWHAKRRKDLEIRIRSFCDKLRVAISSATRGYVQNALYFYFNRFAKRKAISLRRNFLRLRRYLATTKLALADYRATHAHTKEGPPPMEVRTSLDQLNWNVIFSDLECWDSSLANHYLDSKIEDTVDQIIRSFDQVFRFSVDKDFQKTLIKSFTFQIPESGLKSGILFPASADGMALHGVDSDLMIEYPLENRVITFGIGKISISPD